MDREQAAHPRCRLASNAGVGGLLGRVEPQLFDVSQETEQSAHLLAAHGRGQVGDLDDSCPRYPAHCANW